MIAKELSKLLELKSLIDKNKILDGELESKLDKAYKLVSELIRDKEKEVNSPRLIAKRLEEMESRKLNRSTL